MGFPGEQQWKRNAIDDYVGVQVSTLGRLRYGPMQLLERDLYRYCKSLRVAVGIL